MDNIFAIKDEYKDVIVGFNNCGLPLGQRADLEKLAEMAQHNPSLQKYFVQYPTPEVVQAYKTETFLAQTGQGDLEIPQTPVVTPDGSPDTNPATDNPDQITHE